MVIPCALAAFAWAKVSAGLADFPSVMMTANLGFDGIAGALFSLKMACSIAKSVLVPTFSIGAPANRIFIRGLLYKSSKISNTFVLKENTDLTRILFGEISMLSRSALTKAFDWLKSA
jgi:hypothetical protein